MSRPRSYDVVTPTTRQLVALMRVSDGMNPRIRTGDAICQPMSGFQRRMVPSCDPPISRAFEDQWRHLTAALCPSHGSRATGHAALMSHSRRVPSALPIKTIVSSGDTSSEPVPF